MVLADPGSPDMAIKRVYVCVIIWGNFVGKLVQYWLYFVQAFVWHLFIAVTLFLFHNKVVLSKVLFI